MELGFVAITILVLVVTAWLARHADQNPAARKTFLASWGIILLGFLIYTTFGALFLETDPASDPVEILATEGLTIAPRGIAALVITILTAGWLWLFVAARPIREGLARLLPTPGYWHWNPEERQWPGQVRGFDPSLNVHAFALGIAQLFFAQTLVDFILAGGQQGLGVEALEQQDIVGAAAVTAILLISVTIATLGLKQDRSWPAIAERLGLARPRASELVLGAGMAMVLLTFQFGAGLIWVLVASPEAFEQQTQLTQAISSGVTTLSGALLVALFSSIGEEIAFRGALQPVIGLWPTTLLFALTHIQYQFTPAVVIIFVVGLLLGWTRKHYGTIAAITTHFLYNFLLLALAVVANQVAEELGLLLF